MCITCQSSPLICRNLHHNLHSPWVCLPQSKLEHRTMVLEVMRFESRLLPQGWGSAQKKGSWIHPFLRQQWKPGNVYNTQVWTGLTPVGRAPQAWPSLFSGSRVSSSTNPFILYLQLFAVMDTRICWWGFIIFIYEWIYSSHLYFMGIRSWSWWWVCCMWRWWRWWSHCIETTMVMMMKLSLHCVWMKMIRFILYRWWWWCDGVILHYHRWWLWWGGVPLQTDSDDDDCTSFRWWWGLR